MKIFKNKSMLALILIVFVIAALVLFGVVSSVRNTDESRLEVSYNDFFVYQLALSAKYPVFYGWDVHASDAHITYTPRSFEIYRPYEVSFESISVKVDSSYWDDAYINSSGVKYKLWGKEDGYEQTIVWGEGKQYLISTPLEFAPILKETILNSIHIFSSDEQKAISISETELLTHYPDKKHSKDILYKMVEFSGEDNIFTVRYSPKGVNGSVVLDSDIRITVKTDTGNVVDYDEHME